MCARKSKKANQCMAYACACFSIKSISLLAVTFVKAHIIVVVCALVQNVMQYEIDCMEYTECVSVCMCVCMYQRKGINENRLCVRACLPACVFMYTTFMRVPACIRMYICTRAMKQGTS